MRSPHVLALCLCSALAAVPGRAAAQPAGAASGALTHPEPVAAAAASTPLTLAQAQHQAQSASPAVQLLQAQLAAAEGARQQAAPRLANNPELSIERSTKHSRQPGQPDERGTGWAFGLAQAIEIGGQQHHRREAAAAALQALHAEIEEARRQARGEAAQRFHAVLVSQRRVQIEQRAAELFERSAQAVAKRRAAGEDTRLDANVARVEAERAQHALALVHEQWLQARSELATALQVPLSALPALAGELAPWRPMAALNTPLLAPPTAPLMPPSMVPPMPPPMAPSPAAAALTGQPSRASNGPDDGRLPYTLDQLITATQAVPRLRALLARENAARARLALERASARPDVTVGLNLGREGLGGARDRATQLTLSVSLPLFKRNEAGVGQALTDVTTAEIERSSALREQQAQVHRLWQRLGSQQARLLRLQRDLLPPVQDNQRLAALSRQAGQIGLLELLVINRQAMDAERELHDALADCQATRIELEHAAGWSPEGSAK